MNIIPRVGLGPVGHLVYLSLLIAIYASNTNGQDVTACKNSYYQETSLRVLFDQPDLHFSCYLGHAEPGDFVQITKNHVDYERNDLTGLPSIDKTIAGLSLSREEIFRLNDDQVFEVSCRIFNKRDQCISENHLKIHAKSKPETPIVSKIFYNPQNSKVYSAAMKSQVTLECPDCQRRAVWFKSGMTIANTVGCSLRLDELKMSDFTSYFCFSIGEDGFLSSPLEVTKVTLEQTERYPNNGFVKAVKTQQKFYYLCEDASTHPWAHINWQIEENIIDLELQNRERISERTLEPKCQVETFLQDADANDRFFSRQKRYSQTLHISIDKLDENTGDMTLTCKYTNEEKPGKVIWQEDGQNVEGNQDNKLTVKVEALVKANVEHNARTIKCLVLASESDEVLEETLINLEFKPANNNPMVLQSMPGTIITFNENEAVELQCPIELTETGDRPQVTWKFNSAPIDQGIGIRQEDSLMSIVILRDTKSDKQGIYECSTDTETRYAYLVMKPEIVRLSMVPTKTQISWVHYDNPFLAYCMISGRKDVEINWYFKPIEGEEVEITQENDLGIKMTVSPQNAAVFIQNPTKANAGTYRCASFDLEKMVKLQVEEKEIHVSPPSVVARIGESAKFLCEVRSKANTDIDSVGGRLIWRRSDKKSFEIGKEEVISGNSPTNILLIVKNLNVLKDSNTTYICTDGTIDKTVNLRTQVICEVGQRQCSDKTCIPEAKFCDGKADCQDGSDEIPDICSNCEPNQFACGKINNNVPSHQCYLRHWHCDGENDCGNGFDEQNCEKQEKCRGVNFKCNNGKSILRHFVCDGEDDCGDNTDEAGCSSPSIIEPSKPLTMIGSDGTTVTLKCSVHGFMLPTVNWRYNWGHLPSGLEYEVEEKVLSDDCTRVDSYLKIKNIKPENAGVYNCETISRQPAISNDINVQVSTQNLCKEGQFNDGAWFEESCYDCFCNGVTKECSSALGHVQSGLDRIPSPSIDTISVGFYNKEGFKVKDDPNALTRSSRSFGVKDKSDDLRFIEGDWNLKGTWVSSYGKNLKYRIKHSGANGPMNDGHVVHITGNNKTMYYCPPTETIWMLSATLNDIEIMLKDSSNWYNQPGCTSTEDKSTRKDIMTILSNVENVGFRVDNFKEQSSSEISDIRLEHVMPTKTEGLKEPEIEMCKCPEGYTGLSCESCADGWERDPNSETYKCRRICSCHECNEFGACLMCTGNRTGSRCRQCKAGFYRPANAQLDEDCKPCEACDSYKYPFVKAGCVTDANDEKGYRCECEAKENGKLISEDCDLCKIAEKAGREPDAKAKCGEREKLSECNLAGTESINPEDNCVCKEGYTGEKCDECAEGYFLAPDSSKVCKKCFCSGFSTSCTVSEDYFYHEITPKNQEKYKIDVYLARRLLNGVDIVNSGGVIQTYAEDDTEHTGPKDNYVIVQPLAKDGVNHIAIVVKENDSKSGLPVYKKLYGGKMAFKLEMPWAKNNHMTHIQQSVFVELDSLKFGRAWTQAVYNAKKGQYEVIFDETWWPGGWRSGTGKENEFQTLTRGQLMRFLMTSNSVVLSLVTKDNALNHARLHGIKFELADQSPPAGVENPKKALVEVCACPEGTNPALLSCEGCTDPDTKSLIRLQASGPDFECARRKEENEDDCEAGFYKFDILTNEKFDECKKGLEMNTKGRVVFVRTGDPIVILCRATSYRGGIAEHDWLLPDSLDRTKAIQIRRNLRGSIPDSVTSESIIRVEKAQPGDSGIYACRSSGITGNITENFQVVVRDKEWDPVTEVSADDKFNKAHPLSNQMPDLHPRAGNVKLVTDSSIPDQIKINGDLSIPNQDVGKDYSIVWFRPNGTRIDPVTKIPEPLVNGPFDVEFKINGSDPSEQGVYTGYFVGKDPIKNPYWIEIQVKGEYQPIPEKKFGPESEYYLVPAELVIGLMDTGKITLVKADDKTPLNVTWRKISNLPGDPQPFDKTIGLPKGLTIDDQHNLIIWAAGSQHSGHYEVIVKTPDDYYGKSNELARLNTKIRVQDFHPTTEVNPNDSGTSIETENGYIIHILNFNEKAKLCKNPKFYLMDPIQNDSTDISDLVTIADDGGLDIKHSFKSGSFIMFFCEIIPNSDLTGKVQLNITSNEPRVDTKVVYGDKNSVYPTEIICQDLNPEKNSNVQITSEGISAEDLESVTVPSQSMTADKTSDLKFPPRTAKLDFTRVGGFDPSKFSGIYKCVAKNDEKETEVPIELPEKEKNFEGVDEKIHVYSVGDGLLIADPKDPEVYSIEMNDGEVMKIVCRYNSLKTNDFLGWKSDDGRTNVIKKPSWSTIDIDKVSIDDNEKVFTCINGGENPIEKKIKLKVKKPEETDPKIEVTSIGNEVDGVIYGVPDETIRIVCNTEVPNSEKYKISKDWKIGRPQETVASLKEISDIAQTFKINSQTNEITLSKLSSKPSEVNFICVVDLEDKETGELKTYYSKPKPLFIREPLFKTFTSPEVASGKEGESLTILCQAKDKWRNKTLTDNLKYKWEFAILAEPETKITEKNVFNNVDNADIVKPWNLLQAREEENYLLLAGLISREGKKYYTRCYATNPALNMTEVSPWSTIEVIPKDLASKLPSVDLIADYNGDEMYPSVIICKDKNEAVPSKVSLKKLNSKNIKSIVQEDGPNVAVFKFGKFNVRNHSDYYTCMAENEFGTDSKDYFLPTHLMKSDVSPNKIALKISSNVNEEKVSGEDRIYRVKENDKLELICEFHGHPAPTNGVKWMIKFDDQEKDEPAKRDQQDFAKRSLILTRGRMYWSQIEAPKMADSGKQKGKYTCYHEDSEGNIARKASVFVELYKIDVAINGLGSTGNVEAFEGQTVSLECAAKDGYLGFKMPNTTYKWIMQDMNGNTAHPSEIAQNYQEVDNKITFEGLNSDAEKYRIRCTAYHGKAAYDSNFFGIYLKPDPNRDFTLRINGPVKLNVTGPLLNDMTIHSSKGKDVQLDCQGLDRMNGHTFNTTERFSYSWKIVNPASSNEIQVSDLADEKTEEDMGQYSRLNLKNLRASPKYPMHAAEIVCTATDQYLRYIYISDDPILVFIADSEEAKQNKEIDKITKDRKKYQVRVDGLSPYGTLDVNEGTDVTLTAIVFDSDGNENPEDVNLEFSFEFKNANDEPIDLSDISEGGISFDGNKVTINGIKPIPGAKGQLNTKITPKQPEGSEKAPTPIIKHSYPFMFNIQPNEDVKEKAPDVVDMNDDTIKIEIEGLNDDQTMLVGGVDEDKTLKCKVLEDASDEAAPKRKYRYGWQFASLSGESKSPSDIAKGVEISKDGTLILKQLKESDQPIRGRCVVSVYERDPKSTDDLVIWQDTPKKYSNGYFGVQVPENKDMGLKDLKGNAYKVVIDGLKDNKLRVSSDKPVPELICKLVDSKSGQEISSYEAPVSVKWILPISSSNVIGKPEDLAEEVAYPANNKLVLKQIKPTLPTLQFGQCKIFNGEQYYMSKYFKILFTPSSNTGDVVPNVEQIATTDGSKSYSCKAIDAETKQPIKDAKYIWKFTDKNGLPVDLSFLYDDVQFSGDQITFAGIKNKEKIDKFLGKDWELSGSCFISVPKKDGNDTVSETIYPNGPSIEIKPSEDGETIKSDPVKDKEGSKDKPKFIVNVDPVQGNILNLDKGQNVTLTCNTIDAETGSGVDNPHIFYQWFLYNKDGSSISSTSLSELGYSTTSWSNKYLTINGVKMSANGITVKCKSIDRSKPSDGDGAKEDDGSDLGKQTDSIPFVIKVGDPTDQEKKYPENANENQIVTFKDDEKPSFKLSIEPLADDGNILAEANTDLELSCNIKDFKNTPFDISKVKDQYQIGWIVESNDGKIIPLSVVSEKFEITSDGRIILKNYANRQIFPPGVRVRCVLESRNPLDLQDGSDGVQRVIYGSPWAKVGATKDNKKIDTGTDLPEHYPNYDPAKEPTKIPSSESISLEVSDLNSCGNLEKSNDTDFTLTCQVIGDSNKKGYSYSWELIDESGIKSTWSAISKQVKISNGALVVTGFMIKDQPKYFGKCLAKNDFTGEVISGKYFVFGHAGEKCKSKMTGSSDADPTKPGSSTTTVSDSQISIHLVGVNRYNKVPIAVGEDKTLKCIVTNKTNSEEIKNIGSVSWKYFDLYESNYYPNQMAESYSVSIDNEAIFKNFKKDIKAKGKCVVFFEKDGESFTMSTPAFDIYTLTDGQVINLGLEKINPDDKVNIIIEGVNEETGVVSSSDPNRGIKLKCTGVNSQSEDLIYPEKDKVEFFWKWQDDTGADLAAINLANNVEMTPQEILLTGVDAKKLNKISGKCYVKIKPEVLNPKDENKNDIIYASKPIKFKVDDFLEQEAVLTPVEGRASDGFNVTLESDKVDPGTGQFMAKEGENTKIKCLFKQLEGEDELHVTYTFDVKDFTGKEKSLSDLAEQTSKNGNELIITGLKSQKDANSQLKVRCIATVKTEKTSANNPPKTYSSDYLGLPVANKAGQLPPGTNEIDVLAKRIQPIVRGIKPDGSLDAQPGEKVTLSCEAIDTATKQPVNDPLVSYSWELKHPSGEPVTFEMMAGEYSTTKNDLVLTYTKQLPEKYKDAKGNCIVYYKDVKYISDRFPIKIKPIDSEAPKPTGDGSVIVQVQGLNSDKKVPIDSQKSAKLKCVPIDAKTKEPINVGVEWDTKVMFRTQEGIRTEVPGSGEARVSPLPNGEVELLNVVPGTPDKPKLSSVRCRVKVDGKEHASPFYRLSTIPDEDPNVPRTTSRPHLPQSLKPFRIKAELKGLDETNGLSGNIGDDITLKCLPLNGLTGQILEDAEVKFVFENNQRSPVDINSFGDKEVVLSGGEFTIKGAKEMPGNVKGKCIVTKEVNGKTKTGESLEFTIAVPPESKSSGYKPETKKPSESVNDDRVEVRIDGLDDNMALKGKPGDDVVLKVHPEIKPSFAKDAKVSSYGWKFTGPNGEPITVSEIAESATFDPASGTMTLKNFKDQGDKVVYGQGVVGVEIAPRDPDNPDEPDTKAPKELVEFSSKNFGVVVSKNPDAVSIPLPKSNNLKVVVVPVGKDGNIRAKPADSLTIKANLIDMSDPENPIEVDSIDDFYFYDAFGREIPYKNLAGKAVMENGDLVLSYMRPTNISNPITGKANCLDYMGNMTYYSAPFKILVQDETEEEDRVLNLPKEDKNLKFKLIGIDDKGKFVGPKGGNAQIGVQVLSPVNDEVLPYKMKFEFENDEGIIEDNNVFPMLADKVTQNEDGTLNLEGIKGGDWKRGRILIAPVNQADSKDPSSIVYKPVVSFINDVDPESSKKSNYHVKLDKVNDPDRNRHIFKLEDDAKFKCNLINRTDGQPVPHDKVKTFWLLTRADGTPSVSSDIAEKIEPKVNELDLQGLKRSAEGVLLQCKMALKAYPNVQYSGKRINFEYTNSEGSITDMPKDRNMTKDDEPTYADIEQTARDLSNVSVEITNLKKDKSLTGKRGDNVTLVCNAIDKTQQAPISDGISIGWRISGGPDDSVISWNEIAEQVVVKENELHLVKLKSNIDVPGGFRGQCIVKPIEFLKLSDNGNKFLDIQDNLKRSGDLSASKKIFEASSTPFPIKISSDDDVDKPSSPNGVPVWNPDDKSNKAVRIVLEGIEKDESRKLKIGDNLEFTVKAFKTVGGQEIPITDEDSFAFDIRPYKGSLEQLPTTEIFAKHSQERNKFSFESARQSVSDPDNQHYIRCSYTNKDKQKYYSEYVPFEITKHGETDSLSEKIRPDDTDGEFRIEITGLDEKADPYSSDRKLARLNFKNGESAKLGAKMIHEKTGNVLPSDRVKFNWVFTDENGVPLLVQPAKSIINHDDGSIELKEIKTEKPIRGYVVAHVQSRGIDGEPEKLEEQKKYASKYFEIRPDGYQGKDAASSKPDLAVKLLNVPKELKPGSDFEVEGKLIHANNGSDFESGQVVYSWDWIQENGERVDLSSLSDSTSIQGSKFTAKNMKRIDPNVRGRLKAEYIDNKTGEKHEYFSPYVRPGKIMQDVKGSEKIEEVTNQVNDKSPEKDGKNKAIKVKMINEAIKGDSLPSELGSTVELKVEARDTSKDLVLSEKTNPKLYSYNVEAFDTENRQVELGKVADSVDFNSKTGTLTLKGIKDGGPFKIRGVAKVDEIPEGSADGPNGESKQPRPYVRYEGDFIFLGEKEKFVDPQGKAYSLHIDGLDERGVAAAKEGDSLWLSIETKDKDGTPVAKPQDYQYAWRFYDKNGKIVSPTLLGEITMNSETGSLKIENYNKAAALSAITARAMLVNNKDNMITYKSDLIKFDLPPKSEQEKEAVDEDASKKYTLQVTSNTNEVYPLDNDKVVIMARHLRPIDIRCTPKFEKGLPIIINGEYFPKMDWYYQKPESFGDIYFPPEWQRMNDSIKGSSLVMLKIDNYLTLSSASVNIRKDQVYKCQSYDELGNLAASKTIIVKRAVDPYSAVITEKESRSNIYAFEGDSASLYCSVRDTKTKNSVTPSKYDWRFYDGFKWIKNPDIYVEKVSGNTNYQLDLDNFLLSKKDVSKQFSVQCNTFVNSTFDVDSSPYHIFIRRKPELSEVSIVARAEDNAPYTLAASNNDILREKFDAQKRFELQCLPKISSISEEDNVIKVWERCLDKNCLKVQEVKPKSENLTFFGGVTNYESDGVYRCRVQVNLRDYDYKIEQEKRVELKRLSPPIINEKPTTISTKSESLLVLRCEDLYSSPQATLNWEFTPDSPLSENEKSPLEIMKHHSKGRVHIAGIEKLALEVHHSGTYTCVLKNEYGEARRVYKVDVQPIKDIFTIRA